MNIYQLSNLPYLAAMVILIGILVALQRRQPRIAIGSWLIGLSFILASLLVSSFMPVGGWFYVVPHVFRLCSDLLAGIVFMLYTGRPLSRSSRPSLLLLLNVLPLLALEVIYGLDIYHPRPYVIAAAAGIAACIILSIHLRRGWLFPTVQSALWIAIATFALHGNYRAAAYWGLGAVYTAAALRLWSRLRQATLGRLTVCISLLVWAASFFIHPWILFNPRYFPVADLIWTMQKFFVTIGMLLVLLEDKVRENEYLAHHDSLTGLPNRRLMEQRLHSAIDLGPTSVVLIDLNGFKAVNDRYGHHAGDLLLHAIARRLLNLLGKGDTLARLGGDEFVIITPHNPAPLAEAIRAALSQPVKINDTDSAQVNASIGIATHPTTSITGLTNEIASQLLRLADHRMYLEKQSSR